MEIWRVFVGAFSEFGGCVYRIPAPILAAFWGFWSIPLQRGVGVRWGGSSGSVDETWVLERSWGVGIAQHYVYYIYNIVNMCEMRNINDGYVVT
jgi:hypothetical protein